MTCKHILASRLGQAMLEAVEANDPAEHPDERKQNYPFIRRITMLEDSFIELISEME